MSGNHKKASAIIVSGLILASVLGFLFSAPSPEYDDNASAHIQAGELSILIWDQEDKVTFDISKGYYIVNWRNETEIVLDVDISGSNYTLSTMNVTWKMQQRSGEYFTFEGRPLEESYQFAGAYWINVTVSDPDLKTGNASLLVTVMVDLEGDGLPDWWEIKYFNTINAVDSTSNFDEDQYTDLQEYQNGTDPTVSDLEEIEPTFLEKYGLAIGLAGGALVAFIIIFLYFIRPRMRAKQKEVEKRKMAAAIEIERELESDFDED